MKKTHLFLLITFASFSYGMFLSKNEYKYQARITVAPLFFDRSLVTFLLIIVLLLSTGFSIGYAIREKNQKKKQVFEKQKEIIQLKSNLLKAQMNPHFMFNILSNIQSIMILKGETEASKYFGASSRLLRLTLDMSKQEQVTLKDEIDYINDYLVLNKLQMNEELEFVVTVDGNIKNTENIYLPGMLIQPFVENAIIHGLSPKERNKKLAISYHIENQYLMVTIQDNGIGREASAILAKNRDYAYKSWATKIVTERIKIINSSNPDNIILKTEDLDSGNEKGTRVLLKFKLKQSLI